MTSQKYKNTKRILPFIVVVFAFFNCNDTVQVPVETTAEKIVVEQNPSLTIQILTELQKRAYDVDLKGKMTPKNKAALTRFQKDHGLPSFCGGGEQVLELLETEPVLLKEAQRKRLNIQIQTALKERGYDIEITGVMDSRTKAVITKFRTDNGLPIVNRGNEELLIKALKIPPSIQEEGFLFIVKTQNALRQKGYDLEVTGIMDRKTKAALTKFQKDNGLPTTGGINGAMLTLKALGVVEPN